MPDPQMPPAGWYPSAEGDGARRWWDGTAWTSRFEASAEQGGAGFGNQPQTASLASYQPSTTAWQPVPATPAGNVPGAAWLPDPHGSGMLRWWDGSAWSSHTAPAGGPGFSSTTVVHVQAQKSVGLAFVLTFFFGAFGLFYATITGGVVMLAVDALLFILGFLTLGAAWFLLFLAWVAGIVWGCVAASNSNTRVINTFSR